MSQSQIESLGLQDEVEEKKNTETEDEFAEELGGFSLRKYSTSKLIRDPNSASCSVRGASAEILGTSSAYYTIPATLTLGILSKSPTSSFIFSDEVTPNTNSIFEKLSPKHSSIKGLIDRMTDEGILDFEFVDVFFVGFRYFAESETVLNILISKYMEQSAAKDSDGSLVVQMRIINVLRKWVENYPKDFENDHSLCAVLMDFIVSQVEKDSRKSPYAKKMQSTLRAFIDKPPVALSTAILDQKRKKEMQAKRISDLKFEVLGSLVPVKKRFIDLEPIEVARQLSLVELSRLKKIEIHEFFKQAWNKEGAEEFSPNLLAFIDWFNKTSYGIAGLVVSFTGLKERVAALKSLLIIAQQSLKLYNYNLCFEIVSGLNLAPISRLKRTWSTLSKKYIDLWKQLNEFISAEENSSCYRNMLRRVQKTKPQAPVVPYLGLVLADLTFAEDGNQTFIVNTEEYEKTINMEKFKMINRIIRSLRQYQLNKSDVEPNDAILSWFHFNFEYSNDEQLYQMSLQCEPRAKSMTTA